MDFSINKLQQTKNNINFKGVEGAYNIKGEQTYTFYPHAHNENEEAYLELHLDTDDANAHLIKNGDIGEIIWKKY